CARGQLRGSDYW
nr:immunoglobulin heavy chain junction region [Mus musculus]